MNLPKSGSIYAFSTTDFSALEILTGVDRSHKKRPARRIRSIIALFTSLLYSILVTLSKLTFIYSKHRKDFANQPLP